MKTMTVRLPENLVAEIEVESRQRNVSKSDVVRERLQQPDGSVSRQGGDTLDLIRDLIGSVAGLPADLSARTDHYLKEWGFGKSRSDRHRISRRTARSK